jgi:ABC-type polysaccharide/polyol phosphate export permease
MDETVVRWLACFVVLVLTCGNGAATALWRLEGVSSSLAWIARLNPFTHTVELIRFAVYLRFEPLAAGFRMIRFGNLPRMCAP